jgi:hypothetical protein
MLEVHFFFFALLSFEHGWQSVVHDLSLSYIPISIHYCVSSLQVLDNLAHDLVYRKTLTSDWNETWVTESAPGSYREELQPLEDPLIKRCLDVISQNPHTRSSSSIISAAKSTLSQFVSLSELAWIPTGCLQMLETLHKFRPNMVLIISDFSSLPDITVAGTGAPLVASKEAGQTKDHSSYLEAKVTPIWEF